MIINKAFFKSKRGVTLTELLISLAILMVVIGPFLGSLLSATKNNADSETKLIASNLAQKAMEEIKAGTAQKLADQVSASESSYTFIKPVNTTGYSVGYKVEVESTGTVGAPAAINGLNYDLDNLNSAIAFNISRMVVNVSSAPDYTSSAPYDLHNKKYILKVSGTDITGYSYEFSEDAVGATILTDTIPNTDPIVVKALIDSARVSGDDKFVISIDSSNLDKELKFYIVDDTTPPTNIEIINSGSKEFSQIYGSSSKTDYNNVLYKITINVYKNSKVVGSLVSYVKK